MDRRYTELAVVTGVKLLAAAGVVYVLYLGIITLFPSDSWPPRDEREEEAAIARYKQKLLQGDSPLSPRTPEDTAVYLGRIIDHEVKTGALPSARGYITQAVREQLDGRVESLASRPEAKALIARVREAVAKREGLGRVVACYERRPGETATPETSARFEAELRGLAEPFRAAPFDPAACPEVAEEIAATYRDKLVPARHDRRLHDVIAEVEKNCLPRRP
jgi:hypothetical protein